MTYANAVLPHALLDAAERWPQDDFLTIAESSFGFLDFVTTADDLFVPIGNQEWYSRGETKSLYDQQPVEASTMAAAAVAAFRSRGEQKYLAVFRRAHNWFHARNSQKQPLANTANGACFDGIQSTGINLNQGAESTLAYLWTELLSHPHQQSVDDTLTRAMAIG
jgi:hypothetical protein